MTKLNCSAGDLAITVRCNLPENLGNIVHVRRYLGLMEWDSFDEPLPSWEVEIATPTGWLAYEYDGYLETEKIGPVPDAYLRRLTPPTGYLIEDVEVIQELQLELLT